MHSFSVLMPVYNEAEILEAGVRRVIECMEETGCPYEVLVIESGSTDGSAEIADRLAEENAAIRVIHEGRRNGFGSAMKLGYSAAGMDWVWLITPDLPFPLTAMKEALPLLDRYDAVLSYRAEDDRTRYRKLQSLCFNTLVKGMFGLRVRCVNSAFKVLRRDFVQGIDLWSRGWTIDAEILYLLQKGGYKFVEMGVPLIERTAGRSKISVASAVAVVQDLMRLWRIRKRLPVPAPGSARSAARDAHVKIAAR